MNHLDNGREMEHYDLEARRFDPGSNIFGYGGAAIGPRDSAFGFVSSMGKSIIRGQESVFGAVATGAAAVAGVKITDYFRKKKKPDSNDVSTDLFVSRRQKRRKYNDRNFRPIRAPENHLSEMPTKYRHRRKRFRKRFRKRSGVKRRRFVGKWKRNKKNSWYKTVTKTTKPKQLALQWPCFMAQENVGKCFFGVPMYDTLNVLNRIHLGDGTSRNAVNKMSMAADIDSPTVIGKLLMLAGVNLTSDSDTMVRTILGPRVYKWEMSNQTRSPITVTVFWCRPRRDIKYILEDPWPVGTETSDFYQGSDLNNIVSRCFLRDGITAVHGNQELLTLDQGFTPYRSHSFCQVFKVVKTKKFMLDAGQCHEFRHTQKKPWALNDIDVTSTFNHVAWRRMLFPLFRVDGCPVYDNEDYARINSGPANLALVYNVQCKLWNINGTIQTSEKSILEAPAGAVTNARYVSKPASVIEAPV